MQDAEEALLSPRQAEVAQMVVSGKSTREIALALALSPRTVETHIAAVYNKYGVSSRAELIVMILGATARAEQSLAPRASELNSNLPARRVALVGRATEIASITNLLRQSRLVTITGAGGVGKTSVALAVGQGALENVGDGVWLVELAALPRGASVAAAIARALSIEHALRVPPIESLRSQLRRKSLLILLDNCEHLVIDTAAVTETLLRDCPQLRILATSREALRVAGEHTYRLPSLRIPSSGDALALDVSRGTAYASIALFAQRAQAAKHTFALNDHNVGAVAEICRNVDGIPLAIELAAARVNVLPVDALASKLESHLTILAGGDRIAMPRHQTMHALIDWSYELLEPAEQRLFEQLSVFVGGCALPEAVAVCGDRAVDEVAMLDMLSSLVDKSLVVTDWTGLQPRYTLLKTFARYGGEKLASRSDAAAVARRHAAAYLNLAERLEAEYDSAPSRSWFERAQREVGNFRAALEWSLEGRHDVLLGQMLVAAMRPVWRMTEGAQRWLRVAAELIDEATPARVAAGVRFATTSLRIQFGEHEQTVADCRQLGETYERLGDLLRVCQTRTWEAISLFALGRVSEGEPPLASALKIAREHNYGAQTAYLLTVMASVRFSRGDALGGRANYAEAISIFESIGAERSAAMAGLNLADAECSCGDVDRAVQIATSHLILVRHIGLNQDISRGLVNLAGYCIAASRWDEARVYAREALNIMQERRQRLFFDTLQHLAAVAALAPSGREGTAHLLRAVRLFGYARERTEKLGYARELNEQREYERVLAAFRAAYDKDLLDRIIAEGAAMATDQAVELAMSM